MNNYLLILMAFILPVGTCYAQEQLQKTDFTPVAIKTNLLYDATGSVNLGLEIRTSRQTSFDMSGNWNPWTFDNNRKWKHIFVQPEFRLWTKETFRQHFFGLHMHYAYYNVGSLPKGPFSQNMKDNRYEGWLAGAGVGYGYRWNFSHRWGLETEIGVGYAYMNYDKYKCGKCEEKLNSSIKHYIGPTKAAITLVYNFGSKKKVEPAPVYIPPFVKKELITPSTPRYTVSYVIPEPEMCKMRSAVGKAYLDFASGKADIIPSFGNNEPELQKIHNLIMEIKNDPDATITGITITGYASPEGMYHSNLTLSEKRANVLKDQIKKRYGFPEEFFSVSGKGEDWSTLDSIITQSSFAEKHRILEIIRYTDIFAGREKKLMDLSEGNPYRRMLREIFPQLRRTEYSLHYTIVPFTVEKGKEMFKSKPSNLSLCEMFRIANTYEAGSEAFNEVFETAARIFPYADTANLNAAAAALERGDEIPAERYLSKVKGQPAAWHNNMGVLHSRRGEYDKAAVQFKQAANAGNEQAIQNVSLLAKYREEIDAYEQALRENK